MGAVLSTNSREVHDRLVPPHKDAAAWENSLRQGVDQEQQFQKLGLMRVTTVGPATPMPSAPPQEEPPPVWQSAWDDVSGHPLEPAEVEAARAKEIKFIHNKGVYVVIPRQQAKARGLKVVTTR